MVVNLPHTYSTLRVGTLKLVHQFETLPIYGKFSPQCLGIYIQSTSKKGYIRT